MKRKFLISCLALTPFFAAAQSANTIQFRGQVTDETCTVTINGAGANPVVLLPSVTASTLSSAGSAAGLTRFTVAVSGCSGGAKAIGTRFIGNQLTSSGNLLNTGNATNVSLQLLDPTQPSTPFNLSAGFDAPGLSMAAGANSASYDFAVRYYAENAGVTAGTVRGAVQYSMVYP